MRSELDRLDAFEITPLQPFGVEIHDDLSRPMSPAGQNAFAALIRKHHLLVAHNQELSTEDRARLMRALNLGRVPDVVREGSVSNVRTDGVLQNKELSWHADMSFAPCPVEAISLYAVELGGPTSTRFVDGVRVLEALSPAERRELEGLNAVHVLSLTPDGRPRGGDPAVPPVIRPVIWNSPTIGPVLYVHYNTTDRIEGRSHDESDAMLDGLFAKIYAPDNIYEHAWRLKDFVVWSNVALQHARGEISKVGRRSLLRASVWDQDLTEMYPAAALPSFARYLNAAA